MNRYLTTLTTSFIIFISSNSIAAKAPVACWQRPQHVAALNDQKKNEFLHSLTQKDLEQVQNIELSVESIYEADVTNEGNLNYVVVSNDLTGTWNTDVVSIFKKTPKVIYV